MKSAVSLLAVGLLSACSFPPGDDDGGSGGAGGSGTGGAGGVDCADRSGAARELLATIQSCVRDDECELVWLEDVVPEGVCLFCLDAVRIDRDDAAFQEAALAFVTSFQQCEPCGIPGCPGGNFQAVCRQGQCAQVAAEDACSLVVDQTFPSVEELEIGLGPDGVVMGHWSISFTGDSFQWEHSDVAESGSYSCANGILSGTTGAAPPYEGSFDPTSRVLLWDGVEYR